jgi:transposase-like protein
MKKDTTAKRPESRPSWDELEMFARGKVQEFIQTLLEEEVTELLGRERYERREEVDAGVGYRNGHGKERKLSTSLGTITVRRPRVRGLKGTPMKGFFFVVSRSASLTK